MRKVAAYLFGFGGRKREGEGEGVGVDGGAGKEDGTKGELTKGAKL